MNVQSHMSTPPHSTGNGTNSVNLEDYETDNIDTEDADLMRQTYRPSTIKVENNPSQDEQSSPMQEKRTRDTISLPRNKGEARDEGEEDEVDEVEEEVLEGKEQEGRRWYALRNRIEARRFSLEKEEKQRLQSPPCKVLHEMDQGLVGSSSWMHVGNTNFGQQWVCGGLDMHNATAWGLKVAASGWGHQGDTFGYGGVGAQPTEPSSKGRADIQPLQVDETVSFDDIGGLSDHIDALKEMVFFPLLYPDFFANYHISPPRGVLLCGPLGIGKMLIARALACTASKAGQNVNFYMRKGADVLSKWVGEAEQQLKLLFEEAQRNQPSIIFFDEIDGLAPVRSSKQEKIHNSIVSTLLALMDGLDSRGQVVLIGATNRFDAIDGALRRPEAAINAFCEKYPQIYTSDDKFVIDLDSVKVEKHDFLEAMSTITPAAHRGATVQSRPLSLVIAPCLQGHLKIISDYISDIFYVVAKGDKKYSLNDSSRHLAKLLGFPYGSSIPFVYRPRLLLCVKEGAGLDHIGSAVLHELERFPVHCLGLPSLLSDPSAWTPKEALVHIVGEARRTTPSILYLPQLQLWWEMAHDQLRAVLLSILEELPSDLPLLLLATSSVPSDELDGEVASLFDRRYIYQVEKPCSDDRCRFISQLVDAVLTIPDQQVVITPKKNVSNPELPKVPKAARGPSETELRAKVEAEEHAIRRLRMCFRDVCSRLLYEKRFSVFHYPVMDEDAPDYYAIVQNPMDITTLLQRVDNRHYLTCSAFLQDVELIPANAKEYNGDDYNGARIVSRAYALRDAILGMLSQMDPALVAFCDKIAVQGKVVAGDSDPFAEDRSQPMEIDTPGQNTLKTKCLHGSVTNEAFKGVQQCEANNQEEIMNQTERKSSSKVPISNHLAEQIESIEDNFVKCTEGYGISELERLYALICRRVISLADANKPTIIKFLKDFSSDESNFHR
ncbi:hypothetical protein SUGI_0168660 [Cryptomeria japonica]|nr:hypothetical protein SUGI_0168660 [Cryptomeria japonica]